MKTLFLRWTHHVHGIFFLLLFSSGLFLYFQVTRTWFNEFKFPLVTFHVVVACVYLIVIVISLGKVLGYSFKKPPIKSFNVWLNLSFVAAWVCSGLIMYFHHHVPVSFRNTAVTVHDWATFLIIPWVLVHSMGRMLKIELPWPHWWRGRSSLPLLLAENRLERRDFVKSIAIGSVFLLVGGWARWLSPILSIPSKENRRRGYFRVYNVTNDYPRYEQRPWSLTIEGLVTNPVILTMEDLRRVPWVSIIDDFHCVTGWSVRGVEMKGVLIKDLFSYFSLIPQSEYVTAYSGDEIYFDSFTSTQLLEEESMLVFYLDEQELKHVQGYPCRLYHPDMYGYKSVKWLERLEFTKDRKIGYWQQSGGYDVNGYL
jgi:hypothetical protein